MLQRVIFFSLMLSSAAMAGSAGPAFAGIKAIQSQPYGATAKIVEIRGERGDPIPEEWVFLLADSSARAGVREVTISDGKITGERTPLKGVDEIAGLKPIDTSLLKTDADAVFRTAHSEANKNELGFNWIDYSLRTDARSNAPVWTVRLYDNMGAVVGTAGIAAKGGAIVSALQPDPDARARAEATPVSKPKGGLLGGVGKTTGQAAKSVGDSTMHFLGTLQETFVGERTIGPKDDE